MKNILNEKLIELEKTSSEFWNIPRESGILINSIIKACRYKNVLEIGTSNGYSALWTADALKNTGGKLTCLEAYEKRINMAKQNLEECGLLESVNLLQGRALELLETLKNEEYDMVFIDATKSEYIKYYEILRTQIKENGLLIADNVDSHREKLQNFVDAIKTDNDFQVSHIPYGGGLLLAYKVKRFDS